MNLRHFVLITIFLTLSLITLGGYVHNTGASLACPDWPLCYGQVMPVMKGGVLIEHSHRMLASLIGFFSILLVLFSRKKYPTNKRIQKFSWVALIMVILQGLLGGLTVIYKLPTLVSTSHLGLSMIFFGTLIYLHHLMGVEDKKEQIEKPKTWCANNKYFFFLTALFVYVQIILGALMRHLGLGGACGTGMKNALKCHDMIDFVHAWIPASSEAQLHMTHRLFAFFVLAYLIFAVIKSWKGIGGVKGLRKMSILMLLTVVAQVKLGILVIAFEIGQNVTTLHLAGAALLLGFSWKQYLNLSSLENSLGMTKTNTILTDLLSLTKPRLSGLVIFTAAIGLYMAPGSISFFKGLTALITTSLIVAGACVINCYTEREEDKLMERTADRPLPSGRMQPKTALIFGLTILVGSLIVQALVVNLLTTILALIATVFYIFLYTPLKKKTTLAVFVGAIPGALPPLMGWTSVTNSIDPMGLILFGILFVWQLPHFLSISIYYMKDYAEAKFMVMPNVIGVLKTKMHIIAYTFLLMVISLMPIYFGYKSSIYLNAALFLGGAFAIYALYGVFIGKKNGEDEGWARNYFWGSLIYLPSLLLLILAYKQ